MRAFCCPEGIPTLRWRDAAVLHIVQHIVGEFGIVPLQDIRALADTIVNQGLAGGMIWSLRFQNGEGRFCHLPYYPAALRENTEARKNPKGRRFLITPIGGNT
jgi:hypothetical protein